MSDEFTRGDPDLFNQVLNEVSNLVGNPETVRNAEKYSMSCVNVTWEDVGRSKGSAYGPNISDCTLVVENKAMSIVRSPNFQDQSFDVKLSKIPLMVGNEKGQELKRISLLDYLKNIDQYLHDSSSGILPMVEEDEDCIVSVQSCYLPVLKGEKTQFNGRIYNYQSRLKNPGVLTIISSSQGTSIQAIQKGPQELFFNDNGKRCRFIAERLSDYRESIGDTNTSKDMSEVESAQNVIFMIQVPVVQAEIIRDSVPGQQTKEKSSIFRRRVRYSGMKLDRAGIEHAIVSKGRQEGVFDEIPNDIKNSPLKRDVRFPCRLTIQLYKSTDMPNIDEENMKVVADQIKKIVGDRNLSSLVTEYTDRSTEMDLSKDPNAPVVDPVNYDGVEIDVQVKDL